MTKKKREKFNPAKKLSDPKRELFCVLYVSNGTRQFFGHAQNCYAEAYNYQDRLDVIEVALTGNNKKSRRNSDDDDDDDDDDFEDDEIDNTSDLEKERKKIQGVCKTLGSRLLTKVDISKRCEYLLDQYLKHEVIDRELAFTAIQRFDLRSKVQAIDSYNKLHNRFESDEEKKKNVNIILSWEEPAPAPKLKSK